MFFACELATLAAILFGLYELCSERVSPSYGCFRQYFYCTSYPGIKGQGNVPCFLVVPSIKQSINQPIINQYPYLGSHVFWYVLFFILLVAPTVDRVHFCLCLLLLLLVFLLLLLLMLLLLLLWSWLWTETRERQGGSVQCRGERDGSQAARAGFERPVHRRVCRGGA